MKDTLKLEIQVISIVHIVAIVLAILFFMIFYLKAHKTHALKSFLVLQLSMIGWMVFKVFKTVSPTVVSRWWFIVAYYFCACVLEAAFLEFGYAYFKGKSLSNKVRFWVYLFPILQFLVVLTNPYHHLFYSRYDFWGDSFGPLFYVHTVLVYTYIGIGFTYCYKQFRIKFKNHKLWYRYLISSAILTPLVLNFLFITKVIHKFVNAIGLPVVFDITPIVFTWSVLVFVYATFNADFLSLSPILKHEIVHKLDTAICVLDSSYDILYMNEKVYETFGKESREIVDKVIKDLDVNNKKNDEVEVEGYSIDVKVNEVSTLMETQYIVTLRDVTPYRKTQADLSERYRQLEEANDQLKDTIQVLKESSKAGARGYVARELHDIIGHSLVVTIKLLEVAKLYFAKDQKMSRLVTVDAYKAIEDGITSMNLMENQRRVEVMYSGESLRTELARMLVSVKNTDINTTLKVKGVFNPVSPPAYGVIKKVCMELLTNSIKHSQCNHVFVTVSIEGEQIDLKVMDNGIGVENISKGNGLKGIEERINSLGGQVEFYSSHNEGFMSKIRLNN